MSRSEAEPDPFREGFAALPRLALQLAAAVAGLVCLYLLLLYGAALLPEHRLREHLVKDEARGEFAADYKLPFRDSVIDYYTECTVLAQAAMLRPTLEGVIGVKSCLTCPALVQAITTDSWTGGQYARYWHGHLVFVKPLASLFRQDSIRLIIFTVSLGLLALFCHAAGRTLGLPAALALTGSFLLTSNLNMFALVSHAPTFWLSVLAAVHVLRRDPGSPPLLFLGVVGSLAAFFSLLQVDSLSLSLPLLCHLLRGLTAGTTDRHALAESLGCGLCWGFGYGATWLAKWGLALWLQPDLALLGGTVQAYWSPGLGSWLRALGRVALSLRLTLALCVGLAGLWLRLRTRDWSLRPGLWRLALPAAIPFFWVFLMPGHTALHHWFVHSIFWPVLAALTLLALPATGAAEAHGNQSRRNAAA